MGEHRVLERASRGLSDEVLENLADREVIGEDEGGFFLYTFSEDVKVYFEDAYDFLEQSHQRCREYLAKLGEDMARGMEDAGTLRRLQARREVARLLLNFLEDYYTTANDLEAIMSSRCYATVFLEGIEELDHAEIKDRTLPLTVLDLMQEEASDLILELLDLPPEALSKRWQYIELAQRFGVVGDEEER
jgi:hypothetical protein